MTAPGSQPTDPRSLLADADEGGAFTGPLLPLRAVHERLSKTKVRGRSQSL